ncbi:hypothetical protein [uncultured Muribaculum sp.]|uniref:hypothetical protein n=1 Tax=uncultured Muribaculum sp. TaxID=1918613 RepID=UPI0027314D07|nr:hypothetical protein [uncultured Muribaculum sp.]
MESKDNTPAIQFEDKLNRFLKGEMTSAEEQEFKAFLNSHPEQKQKAIAIARLTKAIQQVGKTRDKAVIDDFKSATKPQVEMAAANACGIKAKPKILNFRHFMVSFSAAASILLCVFGGYKYYKYEQVTSLGQEYLAYFSAAEYSRGERDNVSHKIETLYTNISDKKDLDTTIEELARMWNESRSETYNDYTEYMPELGWMLANAYLRDNEKGKAIEVLDDLIAECPDDTAIGEIARELKQKVEKL